MVEYTVAKAADETNQSTATSTSENPERPAGMELAFVDIGIPKNAVLYRGDISFDMDDVEGASSNDKRIEQMIRSGQTVICQVTKTPSAPRAASHAKGLAAGPLRGPRAQLEHDRNLQAAARRRASTAPQDHRRRQARRHGIIIRTAAEGVTADDSHVT